MRIKNKKKHFIKINLKPEKIKVYSNYMMIGGISQ